MRIYKTKLIYEIEQYILRVQSRILKSCNSVHIKVYQVQNVKTSFIKV